MRKIKKGFLAVTGAALGVLTLRTLRQRRAVPEDSGDPATEVARSEAQAAVDHAAEAASHARVAGEKTVEYVENEVDEIRTTTSGDGSESGHRSPVRRLRKVGKGWIRR